MKKILTFTVSIDVTDDGDLVFGDSDVAPGPELAPGEIESLAANPAYVAPLPVQQIIAPMPAAVTTTPPITTFQTSQRVNPTCPVHHIPAKYMPAGTSKGSGKKYAAFWKCSEKFEDGTWCKWTQGAA